MDTAKEQKRKRIRKVATKLFVEKGFENTTTRDIAKAADINKAALYYYFDSKEELLYQILDDTVRIGLDRIREIERSKISLKKKLTAVTDMYTLYYAYDTDMMKLLVHDQKSLRPEHKKKLVRLQKDYVKVFVKILEDLKKNGEISDIDTTVCAFAFFGMVHWAYRWYSPGGRIKPDQLSEMFNQIFTKGIFSRNDGP
jgi:AcrR family transcriptional regulator